MEKVKFELLFRPVTIGKIELPNRIVMAPMDSGLSDENGFVTPAQIDYYEARAIGGVGLVVIEAACIDSKTAQVLKHQTTIDDERYIPRFQELTRQVHSQGAHISIQLNHGGTSASLNEVKLQPFAPSQFTLPDGRETRAMSKDDIAYAVEHFVKSAKIAKKSGFDMVEIQAAHGFLVAQFLSPSFNNRNDEYGREVRNRARFLLDIIKGIKKALGTDYPVIVRMNGIELKKNGLSSKDAVTVAKLCEDAGADASNVSAYAVGHNEMWRSLPTKQGALLPYAMAIKEAVKIPVIAIGLLTPDLGEKALREKKADLIAFGRGFIADPELFSKISRQETKAIRPCVGCMLCLNQILQGHRTACSVNPTAGREKELVITKAKEPKRIMVVGGGPAGMEAARVSRLRGHEVVLYEKHETLGGQLNIATIPPHKELIQSLIDNFTYQLNKLGVKIELGKEVTAALVKSVKPHAVIVATGITLFTPKIPGLDKVEVVTAEDVLNGKAKIGSRVLIIGGGIVGCETAEFLAVKGKKVVVCEILKDVAIKEIPPKRELLLSRLQSLGVRIMTSIKLNEISKRGVLVTSDNSKELLEADTIVLAAGGSPNQALVQTLEKEGISVYTIGDCKEPRGIKEAIDEGLRVALIL